MLCGKNPSCCERVKNEHVLARSLFFSLSLDLSVQSPKQQARSVSVRKKDKCLVSNRIWLEQDLGLRSLRRLRAGMAQFLRLFQGGMEAGRPRTQGLDGAPHPSSTQKETKGPGQARGLTWVILVSGTAETRVGKPRF